MILSSAESTSIKGKQNEFYYELFWFGIGVFQFPDQGETANSSPGDIIQERHDKRDLECK